MMSDGETLHGKFLSDEAMSESLLNVCMLNPSLGRCRDFFKKGSDDNKPFIII